MIDPSEDRADLSALTVDFIKQVVEADEEVNRIVDAALHNAHVNIEAAPVQGPTRNPDEFEQWQ